MPKTPTSKMSVSRGKLTHIANAIELLQNTLKCVICLEMLREPVSTRCGHHFCNLCLTKHLDHKKNGRVACPLCSTMISRRGIVENSKIKRQVDGVIRVIKAIEADSSVDILQFRQAPSSTNEANSPGAGPSRPQNHSSTSIEEIVPADSDSNIVEDSITPKRIQPIKNSSAEKVHTWLLQNKDDFGSKNILNEFANPNGVLPCDEDSDNDMISVSQINTKDSKSKVNANITNKTAKNVGTTPVKRSLKVKEINKITLNKPKSTDDAFDKLLEDSEVAGASNIEGNINTRKCSPLKKAISQLSCSSSRDDVTENTRPEIGLAKSCDIEPRDNSSDVHSNSNDGSKKKAGVEEVVSLDVEVSRCETNSAHSSKKPPAGTVHTQVSSIQDSCELIPSSENADHSSANLVRTKRILARNTESKKELESVSSDRTKKENCSMKRQSSRYIEAVPSKKAALSKNTSPGSVVTFVKVGRFGVSKRSNVHFVKCGRVVRERRFIPVDIRCYCMDHPVLLLDFNEPDITKSVSFNESKPEKEVQSVAVQTSANQDARDVDNTSEDMFPISPPAIVQSGGEIIKRRSNNSSVVSDGIMDAVTVLLSQPNHIQRKKPEPEPVSTNNSESLLSSMNIEAQKSDGEDNIAEEYYSAEKLIDSGDDVQKETFNPAQKLDNEDSEEDVEDEPCRKVNKRPRQLSSSDESDYGEQKIRRPTKKKSRVLSGSITMEDHVPAFLDQTLESPTRLVQGIKAKINAGMFANLEGTKSPRTCESKSPDRKVEDELFTPPEKKQSSDSDLSDCEILEATPQHKSMDVSRSLRSADESCASKAVLNLNESVLRQNSCTPSFVEPTQAPFDELPPIFNSVKKSTLPKNSREPKPATPKITKQPEEIQTPKVANQSRTPQRALREKNTTTLNNISKNSAAEDKKKEGTPRSVQKLPPKAATPKTTVVVKPKVCLVCSGLTGNLTALVQKLAAMVGADYSTKFDAKTTHLVVKTKDDNTTDKTLKYLCAVAAKKWVVSFQWVVQSIKEEKLLPEEKFEVLDTTGAEGPRLSRISPKLLFAGFEFCIFPPLSDITKEQLEELVKLCGATVISDPKKFSFNQDVLPLCLAEWDEDREQEYEGWVDRYCVPLVQHEWVLDCIGRFSLVSFWTQLMSDVSDESLRNMGYPAALIEHSDSTDIE